MRISLADIQATFAGFERLTELAFQLKGALFEKIEVDMSSAHFLAANMCAPLGAILYRATGAINSVEIVNLSPPVEAILSKNGFLSNYGRPVVYDTYGTTIAYKRFEPKDDRYFGSYICTQLVGHGIPSMSLGLRKRFEESVFEIFSNAVLHSRTELGIYSCGQHFPKKSRLDFTIADLGIGIRANIRKTLGLELSSEKAIEWATIGTNTTKTGPIPGGLGLKLLREFVVKNEGSMQIVSESGFWELGRGGAHTAQLKYPFPGTVVNIEINTADPKSYCLVSEVRPENVF